MTLMRSCSSFFVAGTADIAAVAAGSSSRWIWRIMLASMKLQEIDASRKYSWD